MSNITDYIRGDTRVIQVNCFQSDGVTPLDLTGATVYFTLNSSNSPTDDSDMALQKTVTKPPATVLTVKQQRTVITATLQGVTAINATL